MNREQGAKLDQVRAWLAGTSADITAALNVMSMASNSGERDDMDAAIVCARAVLDECRERLEEAERLLHPREIGEAA